MTNLDRVKVLQNIITANFIGKMKVIVVGKLKSLRVLVQLEPMPLDQLEELHIQRGQTFERGEVELFLFEVYLRPKVLLPSARLRVDPGAGVNRPNQSRLLVGGEHLFLQKDTVDGDELLSVLVRLLATAASMSSCNMQLELPRRYRSIATFKAIDVVVL